MLMFFNKNYLNSRKFFIKKHIVLSSVIERAENEIGSNRVVKSSRIAKNDQKERSQAKNHV